MSIDTARSTDHRLGFRTLSDEVVLDSLPLEGEFPTWLEGTLVRNGPAQFEAGGRTVNHWFDGLAMLHAFSFAEGRVAYRNRFVRSAAYAGAQNGEISHGQFATDPCRSIFQRVASSFQGVDAANPNVNVIRMGDRFLALTETPIPVEFDPRTLETLGVGPKTDHAPGQITVAHPHQDPVTGDLVSYAAKLGPRTVYNVYSQRPGEGPRVIASIPVREPAYMHSFGITESHAILTEWPLVVNPVTLGMGALRGRPFIENYEWRPERGTRIQVVGLRDGSVRTYEADADFAFHHVNAFERDGQLIMDVAAYGDPSVINDLYLDRLEAQASFPDIALKRITVDLDGGGVTTETLSGGFELARIDYRNRNGREYRYAYGLDGQNGVFLDTIQKIDLETREVSTWSQRGCTPGEPVFVAAPGQAAEDHGVALSVVLDAERGMSFLLALDAAGFTELGRAQVPHHIPFGFHGQHFGGVPAD